MGRSELIQNVKGTAALQRQRSFYILHQFVSPPSEVFTIVMPYTLGYGDISIVDYINKPVFVVDPSASFPFRAVFQRFGLSFSGKKITLNGFQKAVYFFRGFLSCDCQ